MLTQVSFIAMQSLIVIRDLRHGIFAALFPIHTFLLLVTKLSDYTVLMVKSDRIAELNGYMQVVVDTRKS